MTAAEKALDERKRYANVYHMVRRENKIQEFNYLG